MKQVKLLSGVFLVKPKKLLTLNSDGMIRLTPKTAYHAFRTDFSIKNQPGEDTIMIIKDGYRWFLVIVGYAKNNFDFIQDSGINDQRKWLEHFNMSNEHIRNKSRIEVKF